MQSVPRVLTEMQDLQARLAALDIVVCQAILPSVFVVPSSCRP